jgi:hypothetical protein
MKALAIRRYKAPMEMMELPRPEPGPGDLLVRVRAASVNPIDYKIRDGVVKVLTPYSFPLILGNECAKAPQRRSPRASTTCCADERGRAAQRQGLRR